MDQHAAPPSVRNGTGLRLDDQLCFALYAASNAVVRSYRPLLREIGLTYPQYLVMLALWQDGPTAVGRIARRLGLDSHAVSPVVERLRLADLVERRGGTDRRLVVIAPTGRGRALEGAASRAQAQVVCATGLAGAELAELRGRLVALAGRLTPDGTAAQPAPRAEHREGDAP